MSSMSRNLSLQKHITPATMEKYERQRVVFSNAATCYVALPLGLVIY